jgi:hypothetical protein
MFFSTLLLKTSTAFLLPITPVNKIPLFLPLPEIYLFSIILSNLLTANHLLPVSCPFLVNRPHLVNYSLLVNYHLSVNYSLFLD